jgi:O-antigen ligase
MKVTEQELQSAAQSETRASRVSRIASIAAACAISLFILWMPLGRPTAPLLSGLVLSVLALALVAARVVGGFTPRHMVPLALFAVVTLVAAWLSPFAKFALDRSSAGLVLLLVFPAAQLVTVSPWAVRIVCGGAMLAVTMCGIDIAWQYFFGASLLLGVPEPSDRWRFTGSLTNANEVGFVALLLPFALVQLGSEQHASRRRGRVRRAVTIITAMFGVLLTGSRATLGGLFVGANVASWYGKRAFLRWSLVVALSLAAIAWIGDLGSFRKRVVESLRPQDEMRLRTWRIAVEAFAERPLFGVGPAVFYEVNEQSRTRQRPAGWETPPGGMPWVHNVPLELLVERGLIGTGAFMWLALIVVRDLRSALRQHVRGSMYAAIACAAAASLATFAAMSLLDLTLLKDWCSIALWLSAGLGVGVAAIPSVQQVDQASPSTQSQHLNLRSSVK